MQANNYDEISLHYNEIDLQASTAMLPYLELPKLIKRYLSEKNQAAPFEILDYGCGPGTSTRVLEHAFSQLKIKASITAVDRNQQNITLAKKQQTQSTSNTKTSYQKIEENQLPYDDKTFDMAFCVFVLLEQESIEKMQTLLNEIKRTLKPGAVLVCVNCATKVYNPKNKWVSEFNQYPSNVGLFKNKMANSGKRTKLGSKDNSNKLITFEDFFWLGRDYKKAFKGSGLT